jgi:outer membrane protein TolC
MRKLVSLIAACGVVVPAVALADPLQWNGPLSRTQAVQRATVAGFDVREAVASADSTRAQLGQTRSAVLPQVGVASTYTNANLPQFGMPIAVQRYTSFSAGVPLLAPNGWANAKAARMAAESADFDAAAARNDAALAAVQAYDRAVLGLETAASRQVAVQEEQENVRLVGLQVQAGKAARFELTRARAALAQAEQSQEDAAADAVRAANDLKVALDLSVDSNIALPNSIDIRPLNDSLAVATTRAVRQRPDVLSAKAMVDSARAQLGAARALYAPIATASAQTYNGTSAPPLGSTGSQVTVTASLPLFDSGARAAAVHLADAQVARAQAELDRRSLTAQVDVADAWRDVQAAQTNMATADAEQADASESLRVALLRRQAGKAIGLEVLDALSAAAMAREDALDARARYDIAIAALHHAAGDPQG